MQKLHFIQPCSPARAAGGVRPVAVPRAEAAQRVLRLTARAWLPVALRRPRADGTPLDERVRASGEW